MLSSIVWLMCICEMSGLGSGVSVYL